MTRRTGPAKMATLLLLLAPATIAAQPRLITEQDLFAFTWVADPQMSPDGAEVAFVRVTVHERDDTYHSTIWIARSDGREPPRPLTAGTRDTSPRWSADGRHLAFVRAIEKNGTPQPPQVHVLPLGGGEPRAITDMPRGAAAPEWSPDGRTIAFASATTADDLATKDTPPGSPPRTSGVRVITEATYRANGVAGWGFVDRDRAAHIWAVDVPAPGAGAGTPRPLTSGEFPARDHRWAPDGRHVYFVADRRPDTDYHPFDSDLYAVPREGGEALRAASIDGIIGAYASSPDGRRLAFVGALAGSPIRSYSQPDLWVVDVPGGTPRNVTAGYDFDVAGGIAGDQRAPRGEHPARPVWTRDGRAVLVRTGEHGNANLVRIDVASGRVQPLTTGDQEVMSYTADAAGATLAFVRSTPGVVGDLHVLDAAGGAPPRRLTSFNDALFAQVTMRTPEEIWYESFDGRRIQGWILKPPAFDASKKYPLVLQIHGGPHAAYGNTFTHEFQWMAAKGFVVLYTNPRGSSNYGQEFGNVIQYAYPGDDYKDLMAGVDEVLRRGYVDERRMAVTGGSGGGLLTNWTVTQTTRFRAAVSQRDISNWASFWYTADFSLFTPFWFRKAPFEDPEEFARRSPITYAARIETPLLFVLGDEDWRTPPSAGGEELFRALKYLKRPTAMVRFPGEHHDLSRSGKPWHRIERLQHIVGWFEKWLGTGAHGSH
jgi:dipeptidyl aminopeptidase/acylaminoacyl peptidase